MEKTKEKCIIIEEKNYCHKTWQTKKNCQRKARLHTDVISSSSQEQHVLIAWSHFYGHFCCQCLMSKIMSMLFISKAPPECINVFTNSMKSTQLPMHERRCGQHGEEVVEEMMERFRMIATGDILPSFTQLKPTDWHIGG